MQRKMRQRVAIGMAGALVIGALLGNVVLVAADDDSAAVSVSAGQPMGRDGVASDEVTITNGAATNGTVLTVQDVALTGRGNTPTTPAQNLPLVGTPDSRDDGQ